MKSRGPSIGFKHAVETYLVRKLKILWKENESLTSKEMDIIFITAILILETLECDIERIRSEAKQIDSDLRAERENDRGCGQRADDIEL